MANKKAKSQAGNLTLDHEKLGIDLIIVRAGDVQHAFEKISTRAPTSL
jgi:hypothetical protein